jgi:hypothetical protein
MAISVEHDVPLMAPNVLNDSDGDSRVSECAEAWERSIATHQVYPGPFI